MNITKVRKYIEAIKEAGLEAHPQKTNIIALALANKAAFDLALPTEPVESFIGWYKQTQYNDVKQVFNEINEVCYFDIMLALQLTEKMVALRYNFLFGRGRNDVRRALLALSAVDDQTIPENIREVLVDSSALFKINKLSDYL